MLQRETNRYLASIDGLRALAVLAVVLFHIELPGVQGGFIGVDIFFVISGFLITRNIMRDMASARWSFATFYARRIARLFPALFTVVFLTTIAGYFVLIPSDLERLAKSALSATFSVSNLYFFSESGYFDASAATKPLLHTWSLSVEEQFYLVWPLLLYMLARVWGTSVIARSIAGFSALAFAFAVIMNPAQPERVFFLTPFRTYQFGLGALAAISAAGLLDKFPRTNNVLGLASVCLIVVLAVTIEGDDHLILVAGLPALATMAFLVTAEATLIQSIFASPPMTWIGQRSYSIYLTHWPLIVLWKIRTGGEFSPYEQMCVVVLSLLSGHMLYVLVEKRYRLRAESGLWPRRRALLFAGFLAAGVVAVAGNYWLHAGYPSRVPPTVAAAASNLLPHWSARQSELRTGACNILVGKLGSQTIADYDKSTCLATPPTGRAYFIIGDSFASGAYLYFKAAYPEIHFGQMTVPGCRLLPPDRVVKPACKTLFATMIETPEALRDYDGIVMASNWMSADLDLVDDLVEIFIARGKHVVLVGQRLRFDTSLPSIVLGSLSIAQAHDRANARLQKRQTAINARMMRRFAHRVSFVDLLALQCPDKCDIFSTSGEIMYLDASHLSLAGVSIMANRLPATYPDLFN